MNQNHRLAKKLYFTMNLLKGIVRLMMVGLALIFIQTPFNAKAQYWADIDSIVTPIVCDSPLIANVEIYGTKCNYVGLFIIVDWGDTSSTTNSYTAGFNCSFNSGSCSTNFCNFMVTQSHSYSTIGEYQAIAFVVDYGTGDTLNIDTFLIIRTTNCTKISGQIFIDMDSNCAFNQGDDPIYNTSVVARHNGLVIGFDITDAAGEYSIFVPDGLTNIEIRPWQLFRFGYIPNCVETSTYTTNSLSDQTKDFSFKTGYGFDLQTALVVAVSPPGQFGSVYVAISRSGSDTSSFEGRLVLDTATTYIQTSSGLSPTSVSGDTLFWNYTFPYSVSHFNMVHSILKIKTDTNAYMGQLTNFNFNIDVDQDEVNPFNNESSFLTWVANSYDPNNKLVSPQGKGEIGRIDQGTELTYTVNFQNTGTAPAKNVFIFDTIQQHLDMSTFQLIGSSHPMTPCFFDGKIIRFDFPNINLPDSNTNEPESHGWVIYSIKADSGFDIGSSHEVKNTAYIYFDYNAPIITNTTLNTIYVKVPLEADVSTTDMLCTATNNGTAEVSVMAGEPPYSIIWNTGDTAYAIDQLGTGLYTVTVTDNEEQELVISDSVAYDPTFTEPTAGEVNGPMMTASWVIYNYTIEHEPGSSYTWEAEGGEVIATANNSANILWYGGPKGFLRVWETSEHGCISIDPTVTEVDVNFLSVEERDNLSISIYPNPASQQFSVINPSGQECNLNIFDAQGRLVKSVAISGNRTEVSLNDIAPGSYTLSLSGMDFNQHIRVMVY